MQRTATHDLAHALGSTLPILVVFVSVLPVLLTAADKLDLAPDKITAWIIAAYGVPGALTLAMALSYRQPLLLTGNLPALVFFASLSQSLGYAEMVAGAALAGIAYVLLTLPGLPRRLAAIVPMPVVMGILAGISLPFVTGLFNALGQAPVIIGATIAAYAMARALLPPNGVAVLPAFAVGLVVAAIHGDVAPLRLQAALPRPSITLPHVTLAGALTIVPVLLVLIALANVPSAVYLKEHGFEPPERMLGTATGAGTVLASFLGPTGVCMPLMLAPFTSGPTAGPRRRRYWTAVIASVYLLLIAALAGAAVVIVALIPAVLLASLAGLALLDVLVNAVHSIGQGPLRLSPVVAFAVASSRLSLLGLGPLFWAVTLGTATAYLLERRRLADEAR